MHDNCHVEPVERDISAEERAAAHTITLLIWGVGCPNCAMRVRNNLIEHRGVLDAYVDHITAKADVTFNPHLIAIPALAAVVAAAGNDGRHAYSVVSVIGYGHG